jgi:hypothetical protein
MGWEGMGFRAPAYLGLKLWICGFFLGGSISIISGFLLDSGRLSTP